MDSHAVMLYFFYLVNMPFYPFSILILLSLFWPFSWISVELCCLCRR